MLWNIDNSEKAVARRLDYLRYPPIDENHVPSEYSTCLPYEAVKLPREITYRIPSIDYAALRCVDDAYHYPYDMDQIFAIIDDDNYYDESMTIGTVAADLTQKYYGLFETDPDGTGDSIIIPLSRWRLDDQIILPDEVYDLCRGLAKEDQLLDSLLYSNLNEASWNEMNWNYCQDKQFLCRTAVNCPESQYYIYFHLNIDLRINSIPADKYNLTLTERSLLMGAIQSGIINGRLLSDGREQKERLAREEIDGLMSDQRLAAWYGERNTGVRDRKRNYRRG